MIKKAPKDGTVEEFIDLVEQRYHTESPTNMNSWINTLRMIAEEPAPNPFTPDQIGVLREFQRSGYQYAAMDKNSVAHMYKNRPTKEQEQWYEHNGFMRVPIAFIESALSWDDPEPLCFADYAPLTSPCEGGEKE